jgi:glutathione S-transferase
MKIYDFKMGPNPQRLRIFVAEKGLDIPYEQVDLLSGKNRTPEMLAKNPAGGLPVLELDDGKCISESVAIARYLEALHPEPNLFGRGALEQAEIEMWSRRIELGLFGPIGRAFQHTHPMFATRIKQFKEYGMTQVQTAKDQLAWLDVQLKDKEFIAASRYTMADIQALTAVLLGAHIDIKIEPALRNLARWHAAVSSRPSAKA